MEPRIVRPVVDWRSFNQGRFPTPVAPLYACWESRTLMKKFYTKSGVKDSSQPTPCSATPYAWINYGLDTVFMPHFGLALMQEFDPDLIQHLVIESLGVWDPDTHMDIGLLLVKLNTPQWRSKLRGAAWPPLLFVIMVDCYANCQAVQFNLRFTDSDRLGHVLHRDNFLGLLQGLRRGDIPSSMLKGYCIFENKAALRGNLNDRHGPIWKHVDCDCDHDMNDAQRRWQWRPMPGDELMEEENVHILTLTVLGATPASAQWIYNMHLETRALGTQQLDISHLPSPQPRDPSSIHKRQKPSNPSFTPPTPLSTSSRPPQKSMLLVTLALYHRDSLSHGNSRRIFGYEAYHWGLLFTPAPASSSSSDARASPLYSFDATDASDIDPVTFRLRNPSMDWWLRAEQVSAAAPNPKLLGQLIVGTLPDDDAGGEGPGFEGLKALFEEVPLPEKNTHPQQSCVTWAVAAVGRMQTQGWVPAFDLQGFKDAALAYADARIKEDAAEPALKEYRAEGL